MRRGNERRGRACESSGWVVGWIGSIDQDRVLEDEKKPGEL